jgi:hypothetical protein
MPDDKRCDATILDSIFSDTELRLLTAAVLRTILEDIEEGRLTDAAGSSGTESDLPGRRPGP